MVLNVTNRRLYYLHELALAEIQKKFRNCSKVHYCSPWKCVSIKLSKNEDAIQEILSGVFAWPEREYSERDLLNKHMRREAKLVFMKEIPVAKVELVRT